MNRYLQVREKTFDGFVNRSTCFDQHDDLSGTNQRFAEFLRL